MTIATNVIVGWDPLSRAWSTQHGEQGTVALPDVLLGTLTAQDEWLNWAADDWGHLVHRRPRAVCSPRTPEQVAALVSWAHDQRIDIAARGGAHSPWGQSQVAGGIVIDMSGLDQVEDVTTEHMTVQAGALWSRVLERAVRRRRTPPVLTDYLSTSVGGTLSSGGFGGASHRAGSQCDQVTALEVATPRGGLIWCTPHRNAAVFDAVRGGQGQVGIITRAVLALEHAPEQVRWRRLFYRDRESFIFDQRRAARDGRFDYLEGQVQPTEEGGWSFMMEAVSYLDDKSTAVGDDRVVDDLQYDPQLSTVETLDFVEFADRMGPAEAVERSTGVWGWPHPWVTAFASDDGVDGVVATTLDEVTPGEIGIGGVVLLYPIRTERTTAPFVRLPRTEVAWLFALLRKASPDDPETIERWLDSNRVFLDRVRAANGLAYPINAGATSAAEWQTHYGDQWAALNAVKNEHDPHRILTPGQGVFEPR